MSQLQRMRRSTPMTPQRITLTRPLPRRHPHQLGPAAHKTAGSGFERRTPARRAKAREGFRKRVFDIDLEDCPQCGGPLTIIAAIEDPSVIAKILTHLGWSARAPARAFDRLNWPDPRSIRLAPEPTIPLGPR